MANKFHLNPYSENQPFARPNPREVCFAYQKHLVALSGANPRLLRECLGTRTVLLNLLGNANAHTRVIETLPFADRGNGNMVIPAGLAPRLSQFLKNLGYRTRHYNKTHWQLLREAWQRLDQTAFDHSLRILFATLPRGHFEIQNLVQAANLVAAAARTHKGKVVHVICKNRDAVDNLTLRIKARVPTCCWRCEQIDDFRRNENLPRIMVSTPSYFATQFTMDAGLVILVGGEVALNYQILEYLLRYLPGKLRYAFIDQTWTSTPSDQMMLEAMFGPVVCRPRPKPNEQGPTFVVWIKNEQELEAPGARLAPVEKERLYWQNQARNDLLAEIAQDLAAGKCDGLEGRGLSAAALDQIGSTLSSASTIVVLVESQAHARALHKLLPEWQVYTNSNVAAGGKRRQTAGRAIITEGFLAAAKPDAHVIIRATGAAAELSARQFTSSKAKLSPPRLLIDLNDTFDCQRVAKRREHYRNNNWQIVD